MTASWRAAGLAVAIMALTGARLLWEVGLVGAPGAEVYGHAWVQWWHAEALPRWPTGTDLALGTTDWAVIDPLPTFLAASVGRFAGVITGYNLWMLGSVLLSFGGGWVLAGRSGGSRWVGGITLSLWPALMGSRASGLTEDMGIGLTALALASLGDTRRRSGLRAGVLLGGVAWCGLLSAWFSALAAAGLGMLIVVKDRRRLPALVLAAAVALALTAPLFWMHGDRLLGQGHRSGVFVAQHEPLWRLNPWKGVDLLSLVTPGRQDFGPALIRLHPGYLGLCPLLLAIYGGWSRWWVILLGTAGIALGPSISIAGSPTGIPNPIAMLLAWVPGGGLLNHHGRALLLGGVAMSVLAARGAQRLPTRWQRWAGLAVLLDLAVMSPLPLPLPVASVQPLDVVDMFDRLPEGTVLVLPAGGPGVHFQRPLLDQRVHHRPLLLTPNRPGLPPSMMQTETGRWMAGLAFPESLPPPQSPQLPADVALVVALPGHADTVAEGLGSPVHTGNDGSAVWVVPPRPESP